MKKIVIALVLVLTMLAMVIPVSALDGGADIGITGSKPIIVDPEDPTDPDDPDDIVLVPDEDLEVYGNTSYYFGQQRLSFADVTYLSRDNNGKGEKIGVMVISTDNELQTWDVTVAIEGFKFSGGAETMKGFTLTMNPVMAENEYDGGKTAGVPATPAIQAANDGTVGATAPLFSGGFGYSRCNWTGALKVLGNTAATGDSSAIMHWYIGANNP